MSTDQGRMELRVRDIAARCIHFTGMAIHKTCEAGVQYEAVRLSHEPIEYDGEHGGKYKSNVSWPCNQKLNHAGALCPKAQFPTLEEARQQAAIDDHELSEFLRNMMPARRAIVAATNDAGGAGTIECPKCAGVLHYSQARSNGHVHARCETSNCLTWIE